MTELILNFLGNPEIKLQGKVLETNRKKAIALLAYLALENERHRRDSLATLLWEDYDQSSALAYLRRTLWEIGHMIGEGWVESDRDSVRLLRENCKIDVLTLVDSIKSIEVRPEKQLKELISLADLYRGDFLEGFSLRDAPAFDSWQIFQAETLRQVYSLLLEEICKTAESNGDAEALIARARQWVALNPLNEKAQRTLIHAYAKFDFRNLALQQYQALVTLLKSELSATPELLTRELYEQIREGRFTQQHTESPAKPSKPALSTSPGQITQSEFPRYPDRFIGRENDQLKIIELFDSPSCRLLTILGPGGIGKTRLAVETGRQLSSKKKDGVFFIPLAAISQPAQLPVVIASSIGCVIRTEESPENPLKSPKQQLFDYLANRQLLLILDNFEQIVSSADLLSEILRAGGQIHILVTSRIRLQLEEEWVLPLSGLETNHPDERQPSTIHPAAVELFLERSQRFSPGLRDDRQDWLSAAQICELVGGVPLGIELAAAWTRSLSVDEIAIEITRSLDFLQSSTRNIPEKHQSMRAVFESSWNLLSIDEQLAFSRLSLFKGSFTRPAAQAAVGASLMHLTQLADQSLIRRLESGRYEIHELLRQFAYEKLIESPDRQKIEAQFCAYFLNELGHRFDDLISNRINEALDQIDREFESIRLAWQLGIESGIWAHLIGAFLPLYLYLRIRGYVDDAWKLFEAATVSISMQLKEQPMALQTLSAYVQAARAIYCQVLARRQEPTQYRCEELVQQAYAALVVLPQELERHTAALILDFGMGMLPNEVSLDMIQLARSYFQQSGRSWEGALADFARGEFAVYLERDFATGELCHQQSLETFTSLGSIWYQMLNLKSLSSIALSTGRYHLALQYAEQCLKIIQEMDLAWETVDVQLTLGRIEVALGNYERAIDYYRSNLKALEALGDVWYIAVHHDCLGYAYSLMGKLEPALASYDTSLAIYRKAGDMHGIGMALCNLGDVARGKNDLNLAISYYQEGYQSLETANGLWGMSVALKKIGQVEWQLGNRKSAIPTLFQALKLAVQMERDPEILEILTALIAYYYQAGFEEHAGALINLVESHPATPQNVLDQLINLVRDLESPLQKSEIVYRTPVEAALKSLVIYDPEFG